MSNSTNVKKHPSAGSEATKKTWTTPEIVDYDYASITKGGANLRTSDDVVGDNYRAS